MKKLAALLLGIAITFIGCSKNDDDPETNYFLLDFENVPSTSLAGPTAYGENLYSAYDDSDPSYLRYTGYYDAATDLEFGINEASGAIDFWSGGIVISQWKDKTAGTYLNQCSVYGNGGHSGSKTFGVVNYSGYNPAPAISFRMAGTEYEFISMWVTNTTYGVLAMENGNAQTTGKLADHNGWLLLTVEGFNAAGTSKGTVEFYLADFRTQNSKGIVKEWTEVDLSKLGKVHRLTFTITGSDSTPILGLNTPAYFCFDDLTFKL